MNALLDSVRLGVRVTALAGLLVLGSSIPASAGAILERIDPLPTTYAFGSGLDFTRIAGSAIGDVSAILVAVDLTLPPPAGMGLTSSGCDAGDWAGFPVGAIALLQRGSCEFDIKTANAAAAGAVAAVVFNEGQPGRTDASPVVCRGGCPIPSVFTSFAVGEELASLLASGPVTVRVAVPEPAGLAVLGLALGAMRALRRRRSG